MANLSSDINLVFLFDSSIFPSERAFVFTREQSRIIVTASPVETIFFYLFLFFPISSWQEPEGSIDCIYTQGRPQQHYVRLGFPYVQRKRYTQRCTPISPDKNRDRLFRILRVSLKKFLFITA
ncbi:hypothetical protein F4679DRAFT_211737 [Xylaria curta]|nr:hypothetical protein F4679DRAFT_211737 [Xylaria curta]